MVFTVLGWVRQVTPEVAFRGPGQPFWDEKSMCRLTDLGVSPVLLTVGAVRQRAPMRAFAHTTGQW